MTGIVRVLLVLIDLTILALLVQGARTFHARGIRRVRRSSEGANQ